MFVFPANDDGYRKRKRAHKACEQCQRRRRRCDFPGVSVRCEPCEKAEIMCSLAPDYKLQVKASPRLDKLARQSLFTHTNRSTSSGDDLSDNSGMGVEIKREPSEDFDTPASDASANASASNANTASASASTVSRLSSIPLSRPTLPPRATSYSHQSTTSSMFSKANGFGTTPKASSLAHNNKFMGMDNHVNGNHLSSLPQKDAGIANPAFSGAGTPSQPPRHRRRNSETFAQDHHDIVGDWDSLRHASDAANLQANAKVNAKSTANKNSQDHRESIGMWVKGVRSQQRLNPHLHTYLASINAFSMPLRDDRMALIDLYCESVDKVFPLLDKTQFLKLHEVGQAPTILLHAVLLVAARHPRAAKHLGHESVRQFCANTAAKIRALLFSEVEQDRLTLVRVYALLSLHSEGPDGLENSCSDLEKAIHYAISLGIHHERPFVDKLELKKLWWSIWCMDRISGCVNARPLLINNEDMGISDMLKEEHEELHRLVQSCNTLEKVIYLYRPRRKQPYVVTGEGRSASLIPKEVDELFIGDDTVNPANVLQALLHYTGVILAHKQVDSERTESIAEEPVVTEDAGLTPATKRQLDHNSKSPSSVGEEEEEDWLDRSKRLINNHMGFNNSHGNFSIVGNYGPRTVGTMYTPLTMILAEEKLKTRGAASNTAGNGNDKGTTNITSNGDGSTNMDSASGSPSIEKRMSDYFSLDTANEFDHPGTVIPALSKPLGKEDTLLLSATGAILRIAKNAVTLPPLPLIPYCVSLTLTVFLRTFPQGDSETGFTWKDSCEILDSMSDRWWVAGAMGCMGTSVFNSLQKLQLKQQQSARRKAAATAAAMAAHTPQGGMFKETYNTSSREGLPVSSTSSPKVPNGAANGTNNKHTTKGATNGVINGSLGAGGANNELLSVFNDSLDVKMTESSPQQTTGVGGIAGYPLQMNQSAEDLYLNMFSDFPNQTSFLDEALTLESFNGLEQWLQEK